MDEEDVYLAAIDVADYDWEDDRPLNYDYSPTEANLDELRAIEGMISVRTI